MRKPAKFALLGSLAIGLIGGTTAFIWLLTQGQLAPFLGAWHIVRARPLPALTDTPIHPPPDLTDWPSSLDDLMIVAHYDDEALAEGGFIASEIKAGKSVGVVIATYSEGQDADQRNWYGIQRHYHWFQWKYIDSVPLRPKDRSEYPAQREQESKNALDTIGVPRANRLWLRYPNLTLDQLIASPDQPIQGTFSDPNSGKVEAYAGHNLIDTLRSVIQKSRPKRILTHFTDDTNIDHRSLGRLVLDQLATETPTSPTVWTFLVHWSAKDGGWVPAQYSDETKWLRAEPREFFQVPAGSPQAVAQGRETLTVPWSGDFTEWKSRLIDQYTSQVKYDPWMLRQFAKSNEIFWDQRGQKLIEVRFGE